MISEQLGPVTVSEANGMLSVSYPILNLLDAALVALENKYPIVKPEIDILKAAIDAKLSSP